MAIITAPAASIITADDEVTAWNKLPQVDSGTATATAGAATLSKYAGVVTSEALTTAAGATYTLTITNTKAAAGQIAFASLSNGTNSAGLPDIASVTPANGSLVVVVRNLHASNALNGTIKVAYAIVG